jgi:hypothetical protein
MLEEVHNYKSGRALHFRALLTEEAPEVELALI